MSSLQTLYSQQNYQQVVALAQDWIAEQPAHFEAYKYLGMAYARLSHDELSVEYLLHAAALNPEDSMVFKMLGFMYYRLGQFVKSERYYRLAIDDDIESTMSYLGVVDLNHALDPSERLRVAMRYGQHLSDLAREQRFTEWAVYESASPLKVGLVSGDFNLHPVAFFLESVLSCINPAEIKITAYPTTDNTDEMTARLRAYCHVWQPLCGLSDSAAAQLIHQHGIHVLIDLSGLTHPHRLGVFAHKPAPIQASWLGYFASTGLPEMDYVLADEVSVPTQHEHHFSERVLRLPDTRLCYGHTQLLHAPAVAPLPLLTNGCVTFGCFQRLEKINEQVLAVWAKILQQLPQSRMVIQLKHFAQQSNVERIHRTLAQRGIDSRRIVIQHNMNYTDYLAAYAQVDCVLDTFPFPGGTTTCEALWMGVPTLTMAGDTMLSRQGQSLLHAARLDDWVADDADEYVRKAVYWASNLTALGQLRHGLRAQVASSPLFDARRFAHQFTQTLRAIAR